MKLEKIVSTEIYRKAAKVIGSVEKKEQIETAEKYLKLAYQKLYKIIKDKEKLYYHIYQLHNELNKKRDIPKPNYFWAREE